MADVGQEEDFEAARAKALKVGAKKFILDVCPFPDFFRHVSQQNIRSQDLKDEFVNELIFPAVRANAIYEVSFSLVCTRELGTQYCFDKGVYLLGTSLARPVIARGMIAIAEQEGCQ